MGMIYQYTSLESLAMILDSKKLKFTKLSLLDDPLEKYVKTMRLSDEDCSLKNMRTNMGGYCYVSCWTRLQDESIAMWDMYGDRKQGVRIGLPEEMLDKNFNIYKEREKELKELYKKKNKKYVKDKPLLNNKKNKPIPGLIDVNYSDIEKQGKKDDNINCLLEKLGRYKISDWEFQKECRFRINVDPYEKSDDVYFMRKYLPNCDLNNLPLERNFILWGLNKDLLSDMQLIIGPNMKKDRRIILKALIHEYHLNDKNVKNSKFFVEEG
jgi:hypothetical protein